jgi:hypothetical protein
MRIIVDRMVRAEFGFDVAQLLIAGGGDDRGGSRRLCEDQGREREASCPCRSHVSAEFIGVWTAT